MNQLHVDFNLTFGSEHGKRVFEHLKKTCGYDRAQDVLETNKVMYREGRRSVIVEIMRRMDEKPISGGEEQHGVNY